MSTNKSSNGVPSVPLASEEICTICENPLSPEDKKAMTNRKEVRTAAHYKVRKEEPLCFKCAVELMGAAVASTG